MPAPLGMYVASLDASLKERILFFLQWVTLIGPSQEIMLL
jgi:hypothetical protein